MNISEIADALERATVFSDTALKQITRDLRMAAGDRPETETFGSRQQTRRGTM